MILVYIGVGDITVLLTAYLPEVNTEKIRERAVLLRQ